MESQSHLSSAPARPKQWYDRYYKLLLVIPLIILAFCLVYLFSFYQQHGDIMLKDVSLSGGTTITLQGNVDRVAVEQAVKQDVPDVSVRAITELRTGKPVAVIVESSSAPDKIQPALERVLGYKLTNDNATIEFTGPILSKNFYSQLMSALIFSFILIAIVIFIMFRSFVPSIAVIFAIFADVVMPLALVNALGIKLSAAGIAAFLMLIGYSVDTDILLTTRVLKKREGSVNERIYGAFKTGIFMNITGLLAVLPAFFIVTGLPDSFRQIFFVLALGLVADIMNTWLTNASILKWYTVRRRMN
jgi:preprotein translocase subunit SecF